MSHSPHSLHWLCFLFWQLMIHVYKLKCFHQWRMLFSNSSASDTALTTLHPGLEIAMRRGWMLLRFVFIQSPSALPASGSSSALLWWLFSTPNYLTWSVEYWKWQAGISDSGSWMKNSFISWLCQCFTLDLLQAKGALTGVSPDESWFILQGKVCWLIDTSYIIHVAYVHFYRQAQGLRERKEISVEPQVFALKGARADGFMDTHCRMS